ncbi:MAG: diguanylate cyclase, partial [Thiomicrorhabdus sp.]|nr:diguanylate cyclase [Thiomicrorhabdus sp.]
MELNLETSKHHGAIFVYHHHLKNLDWILLSHIDKSEVYAPLYKTVVIVSLFLILVLTLLLFVFRNIQQRETERIQLEHIEASRAYFMELFTSAPVAYCLLNHQGHIIEVNDAWIELTGFDKTQALGRHYDFLIEEPSVKSPLESLFTQKNTQSIEFLIRTANGEHREVNLQAHTSFSADATLTKTHCIFIDVTEQRQTEKRLRLAAKVFSETGEGIMVTTADLEVVMVNNAFTRILGYQPDEIIGKTPRLIKSGRHDKEFYQTMWEAIKTKGIWQGEIWNRHKSGYVLPEWLTITELKDLQGEVENYVGVFADITQLKESETKLDYLAHHDALTGLINRRRFIADLDYAITHAKRDKTLIAVLMLGLDRFKDVNDSFGHGVGDEVLIKVSQLLQETIREADGVARLGGDQFVVLLEDLHSQDDAARVANKLIQILSEPFKLNGNTVVSMGCSIGISLFPNLATNSEELLQQADSALYLAKNKGRGSYQYFSVEMMQHALQRMAIESELKLAVRNNELRVFYQPQVDILTGQLKGVEALVRWQH